MDFNQQTLSVGDFLDITVAGEDVDGNPVPFDGTWQWDCAVRLKCASGEIVGRVPLALTDDGALAGKLPTTDFAAGVYWYDIRLIDAAGDSYTSQRTRLVLVNAVTPPI